MAELELELGRERRAAAKASRKARNLPIGRPRSLPADKIDLAERMRAAGEPVPVIAEHLGSAGRPSTGCSPNVPMASGDAVPTQLEAGTRLRKVSSASA